VAESLAESYGSSLHLVQVVPVPIVDGFGAESYVPDVLTTLVDAAKSYLQKASATVKRSDVATKVIVGSPAIELEDYVSEQAIDLVVMTSHGRSGFMRTALGSITDRLLGGAAPVLVVRPRE
jgi:nucleotide-binding universal stress UspA family protein